MIKPPRHLQQSLFDKTTFLTSFFQGLSILTVVFVVFLLALKRGSGEQEARSLAFVTLVFCNLMLIVTNLSQKDNLFKRLQNKNKALYGIIAGTVVFLFLVLSLPFLRGLFHFSYLPFNDLLLGIGLSLFTLAWFEVIKTLRPKKSPAA